MGRRTGVQQEAEKQESVENSARQIHQDRTRRREPANPPGDAVVRSCWGRPREQLSGGGKRVKVKIVLET